MGFFVCSCVCRTVTGTPENKLNQIVLRNRRLPPTSSRDIHNIPLPGRQKTKQRAPTTGKVEGKEEISTHTTTHKKLYLNNAL
jgi:hypothetical protein